MSDDAAQGLVDSLLASEKVGGAAAGAWAQGGSLFAAAGLDAGGRPVSESTRFDLASLTKPFAATLALCLARRGELPLEMRVGEAWPRAAGELADRSCEELLRHRSGLRAWAPLYRRCKGPHEVPGLLLSGELTDAPPDTYSDLGYVLWGLTAERVTGKPLRELFRTHVFDALEGEFSAGPGSRTAVVSHLDNRRERRLARDQGVEAMIREQPGPQETQDGNAHFLGGVAGHAGLFASLAGMRSLVREWLRPHALLAADQVEGALAGGGDYALGWARRCVFTGWNEGLEPRAFGHVGFTGGAAWIEPEAGRMAVLLVSRDSDTVDLDPWRRRLQALVREL